MNDDAEFWDEIIRDADGNLDETKILAELHDYFVLLVEVPRVYDYITCGQVSKPHTRAVDVIAVSDRCADETLREVVRDVLGRVKAGESPDDILEEFKSD